MGTQFKTGALPYVKPELEPAKLDSMHHLYQPGEEVKCKGVTYVVMEGHSCKKCVFWKEGFCHKPKALNECCGYSRADKTWIYFVIKEK